IKIPGQQMDSESGPLVEFSSISEGYFRTMGIPLLQGREFNRADFEITAKVIREAMEVKSSDEAKAIAKRYTLPTIINQTMPNTVWPLQNPEGKNFENRVQFRVIGVVGDVKQMRLREQVMPQWYAALPWNLGVPSGPYWVVVQSTGAPPQVLAGVVRSAV